MFELRRDLAGVDWSAVKADLARDRFDNGRTPEELGGVVDGRAGDGSDREAAVVGPAADGHRATVAVAGPALGDPAEPAGRYLVQAGDRAGVVVEERHRLVELVCRGELQVGTPE